MKNIQILIAEDDIASAVMMKEMLSSFSYDVSLASNGKEALQLYKNNSFPIVITDIDMPEMNGHELIKNIKNTDEEQIIIVTTAFSNTDLIIDIMKNGIYDYIVKPVDFEKLKITIHNAAKLYKLKQMEKTLSRERIIKLEKQLEWYTWQDNALKLETKKIENNLFKGLHHNFSQGDGFGALLSIVDLISASAEKKDDHYIINQEIFHLIEENATTSRIVLDAFRKINDITSNDLKTKKISALSFYQNIEKIKDELNEFSLIENNFIILAKAKTNFKENYININLEYITLAIRELFMNALKFSKENFDVLSMLEVNEKSLIFSVINNPKAEKTSLTGIPNEYENLVFEPFFRIGRIIYKDYKTLDYGLGLTLVEKIISKHEGTIKVSNIKDYSNLKEDSIEKVAFSIELPLA